MYASNVGSILLVEAEPDARDQLGSAIKESGHEAVLASSIREAFALISEGGIDVVVIDSNDPRGSVVELARSMQALPDAPPLVLVSSSPSAPEISARIGAAVFLTKPYDRPELIAVLNRLLGELRPVRIVEDEPTIRLLQPIAD
jgi:DNA-binding response OmpR family regulator